MSGIRTLAGWGWGVGFGVGLLVCVLLVPASDSMAQAWSASFLTTSTMRNRLESPPAHDGAGNVVAVWEQDSETTLPKVMVARRAGFAATWSVGNIRTTPAPDGTSDRWPVVVTDGSGEWLCVWSSNDSLEAATGSDYDIVYSRSVDAGASWSAPALLNSTGLADAGDDTEPWVTMDAAGNCVAAWTSDSDRADVGGTTSTLSTVWISRSPDGGLTWSAAEAMNRPDNVSVTEPCLTTDGTGGFGLVWVARTGTAPTCRVNFLYSDNSGSTWSLPRIVNLDAGTAIPASGRVNPAVAGDGSGRWMVAWNSQRLLSFDQLVTSVHTARTQNNGTSWVSVGNPSLQFASDVVLPSMYTDGAGTWCLGFHRPPYDVGHLALSRDFGANWDLAPAFPSTKPPFIPGFPEPSETTPFAWRRTSSTWEALFGKVNGVDPIFHGGRYEIRHAISPAPVVPPVNEDWSAARSFAGGELVYGTNPSVAANELNTWVTVYRKSAGAGQSDTEIGFSRSTNGGRDWSSPEILNSDWQSDGLEEDVPSIAASEGNVWLCTWARSDGKVWIARSVDDGATWSAPQNLLAGAEQVNGSQPDVTSLGEGNWLVVWQGSKIFSAVSDDDGLTWGNHVFVAEGYQLGFCGNTSPCSVHSLHSPRVHSARGNSTAFVGFYHQSTSRPNGYVGPTEYWESDAGYRTADGGTTYEGNTGFSPVIGPNFNGSREMAADGNGNWMIAYHGRRDSGQPWAIHFGHSYNNGTVFHNTALTVVAGRAHLWGKVAMDAAGHWFRMWGARQQVDLGLVSSLVLMSASVDSGGMWGSDTRLDTANWAGANEPAEVRVKGSKHGAFVAVWQANLPLGEPTIWFSYNDKHHSYSAVADWQLFQ